MHIHIALYKWKAAATPRQIERALAEIAGLADKVPGVTEISCAENASKYSEGYTHVILVHAKDQAAIDAYRAHPDHQKAAQQIEAMELHGIGVDFDTK
jgi:heme-degrading monooxygenase HmoA